MSYLFAFFILIVLFYLCLNTQAQVQNKVYYLLLNNMCKKTVLIINVPQLKQIQNKVALLDTRETKEYNISHLLGAMFEFQLIIKIKKQLNIINL